MKRFWDKVNKTKYCWLWTASTFRRGYGQIRISGKNKKAHRVSWELHFGKIPEGVCVLHKCDVPGCVNPEHLFLGTYVDNVADMDAKGRRATGVRHWTHTNPEKVFKPKGELHPKAKLTESKVQRIRALLDFGFSQSKIADKFNITQSQVSHIKMGNSWARQENTNGLNHK